MQAGKRPAPLLEDETREFERYRRVSEINWCEFRPLHDFGVRAADVPHLRRSPPLVHDELPHQTASAGLASAVQSGLCMSPELTKSSARPASGARLPDQHRCGVAVFLAYLGALVFYLWVRITKTLDLGPFRWYGILVLVIECLGATTVILYGINLLRMPVATFHVQARGATCQPAHASAAWQPPHGALPARCGGWHCFMSVGDTRHVGRGVTGRFIASMPGAVLGASSHVCSTPFVV
jgi:hypothetical protein